MTLTPEGTRAPACVENADLFHNPPLEEPERTGSGDHRRQTSLLMRTAEALCLGCPLMIDCLYRAVVHHDIAGYCAGTTQQQRTAIRRRLGLAVDREGLNFAESGKGLKVNYDELVRLRNGDPAASLSSLAQRLGCSVSTVKRHLNKARRTESALPDQRPAPALPSRKQVLEACRDVLSEPSPRGRNAA